MAPTKRPRTAARPLFILELLSEDEQGFEDAEEDWKSDEEGDYTS
jgi:hypothetical protein